MKVASWLIDSHVLLTGVVRRFSPLASASCLSAHCFLSAALGVFPACNGSVLVRYQAVRSWFIGRALLFPLHSKPALATPALFAASSVPSCRVAGLSGQCGLERRSSWCSGTFAQQIIQAEPAS
jgi:hypothetical protein